MPVIKTISKKKRIKKELPVTKVISEKKGNKKWKKN
jgi:hypothetical protein